jgi:hypothetical protein
VATWADVVREVSDLPEVSASTAHEGSPAFEVRHRQFLRQRVDDGRTILQFWVRDAGIQDAFVQASPDTFWVHHRFTVPATMAWLDLVDSQTLREVLVESWTARAPKRLVQAHPNLK